MSTPNKPNNSGVTQTATAGGNINQVGGHSQTTENSNHSTTTNSNNRILISFVLIIAFGGLAIAAYFAKDMENRQDKLEQLQQNQTHQLN